MFRQKLFFFIRKRVNTAFKNCTHTDFQNDQINLNSVEINKTLTSKFCSEDIHNTSLCKTSKQCIIRYCLHYICEGLPLQGPHKKWFEHVEFRVGLKWVRYIAFQN